MSAGMADCSAYKELIQLVLDNESSTKEEAYLRMHLKMCLKCLSQYEIDKELKEVLKLKLEKKQVPVGLSETIRSKLIQ
tara:strand:+ start:585 stop:821 length:237 start_codon:yes stop_codon:yes gene_type:complete